MTEEQEKKIELLGEALTDIEQAAENMSVALSGATKAIDIAIDTIGRIGCLYNENDPLPIECTDAKPCIRCRGLRDIKAILEEFSDDE